MHGELSGQLVDRRRPRRGARRPLPGAARAERPHRARRRRAVARYLPLGLPEDTRSYVARAVRGGHVKNLNLRVKGDLWDFPFHRLHQRATASSASPASSRTSPSPTCRATRRRDGEPAFESPWPAFTQVRGELVFDRATMEIRNAQARVYGVDLTHVQGDIRNLIERPTLAIEGQARGPLADMLRYVNTSPIGEWTDRALAQTSANGIADLKLALSIPLHDGGHTAVKGSVTLANNDVRINPDTPLLASARARVRLHAPRASASAAAPHGCSAATQASTAACSPNGSMRFNGQGGRDRRRAAPCRRARHAVAPRRLDGRAGQLPARARAGARAHGGDGHQQPGRDGLRAAAAAAQERRPRCRCATDHMQPDSLAAGHVPRDTLRFELGNVVQAQYVRELRPTGTRVLRGGIGIASRADTAGRVAAALTLPMLNGDAWEAVAQKLAAGPASGVRRGGAGRQRHRGLHAGHGRAARADLLDQRPAPDPRRRGRIARRRAVARPTSTPSSSAATSSTGRRAATAAPGGSTPASHASRCRRPTATASRACSTARPRACRRSTSSSTTSSCRASASARSRSRRSTASPARAANGG
jgi:hypothetical protein